MPEPAGFNNPSEDRPAPEQNQVWIETREKWTDAWTWEPELEPVRAELLVGSMGRGRLTFRRRYGPKVKASWELQYHQRDKWETLVNHWIRVRQAIDDEEVTLWVGRVEAPVEQVAGDQTEDPDGTPQPSGAQEWLAYGPLRELEKATFQRSTWVDDSGIPEEMDWLPDFNMRHGDPGLAGNRSTEPVSGEFWLNPIYCFEAEARETYAHWRSLDICEYALQVYVMSAIDPGEGPDWRMGGDALYLETIEPQIQLASVTNMRRLMSKLIPNARGIDYHAQYFENPGEEGFELIVFGLQHQAINFAGYQNLPNLNVVALNASDQRRHIVSVERASVEQYDKLRLVGDRILSVCSIAFADMCPGWTAEEKAAYEFALIDDPDATAKHHDAYRADERFRFVFQRFIVEREGWDYHDGLANPVFLADGSYSLTLNYYQLNELGTLPTLPLEVGVDYTTDPPTGRNPPGTKADYLPLLVFVRDARLERYVLVNKLPMADPQYPGVEVRALEHELGFLLRSTPNHLFAKNHWGGAASPSNFDPEVLGFDYDLLVATIPIETDNRIIVEYELPAGVAAGTGAVKTVVVPIAQFWWLTAGTYIGVGEDGEPLTSPSSGVELRNDIELLRAMMPGAIARFSYERMRATVRRLGEIEAWGESMGAMLTLEGEQGQMVDTEMPVTSVVWDFVNQNTTVLAGQAQRAGRG